MLDVLGVFQFQKTARPLAPRTGGRQRSLVSRPGAAAPKGADGAMSLPRLRRRGQGAAPSRCFSTIELR